MKKVFCILFALLLLFCSGCSEGQEEAVKLIEIPLTQEEYAFGVDKNQPMLLQEANAFVKQLLSDGTFAYYPDKDFSGTDTFTYTYNNLLGESEECTVEIRVAK